MRLRQQVKVLGVERLDLLHVARRHTGLEAHEELLHIRRELIAGDLLDQLIELCAREQGKAVSSPGSIQDLAVPSSKSSTTG